MYPNESIRIVSQEVDMGVAQDYKEAASVLKLSPQASAALSRKCLERVLEEKGGVNSSWKLNKKIEEIKPTLPGYLQESLDYLREIGNYASHPNSREITLVEEEEAEWALDVLDLLFEHYYVLPAKNQKIKERSEERKKKRSELKENKEW